MPQGRKPADVQCPDIHTLNEAYTKARDENDDVTVAFSVETHEYYLVSYVDDYDEAEFVCCVDFDGGIWF